MISDKEQTHFESSIPGLPVRVTIEQVFSPIGISLGILWLLFLVWVASFIAGGQTPGRASIPKARQSTKKSHTTNEPWKTSIRSIFTCQPIKSCKQFFRRLPRRIWNFYIEAVLIPSYRPEWGKYKEWSFQSPDRVESTEEEREARKLKRERDKLEALAKSSPSPTAHDHSGCARIKINVNGRIFETQLRTLNKFPDTLLGNPKKRAQYYDPSTDSYFFDRMPSSFEAILYFFQSGGFLRRPENVHLDIFYNDAEFFGLPQSVIDNFMLEEGVGEKPSEADDMPKNLLQRKIWLLLDYPESSIQARIVAICSVFVIVLSIFMFCVETVPQFQGQQETTTVDGEIVQSAFEPLDLQDPFFLTETICSIWFTAEYLVRFAMSPNKWTFLTNVQNVIDLVSIVPYFLTIATVQSAKEDDDDNAKDGTASLSTLRVIRLVRVFRIFKLSRHSQGLKILGQTLKSSMSELFLLIFFVFLGVIMFSSCLYFVELGNPNTDFVSIPHGFWYSVITMTTVGYGDTVPQTLGGKIVGSLCAITGVLTIALPVPVIVSNFNYFYHQSIDEQELKFTKMYHVENCPYRPAAGDEAEEEKMRKSFAVNTADPDEIYDEVGKKDQ